GYSESSVSSSTQPVKMLLLQVLIVISTWSCKSFFHSVLFHMYSFLQQQDSSKFLCDYIHWYRQSPGAAPERILYIGSGSAAMDAGFDSKKFIADNYVSASTSKFTVHQVTREDAGTYYCATWDRTVLESHRQPVQKPTLHSEPQPFKCRKPDTPLILPLNLEPTAETADWFLRYDRKNNSIELQQHLLPFSRLSFLSKLYPSIPTFQSCVLSHQVSVMPTMS
uniref:Ig-like domain-containing protein n=1 Tax=Chelydra serpentina TaxID=8475 RepID=A0A8C3TIR1_CHESE